MATRRNIQAVLSLRLVLLVVLVLAQSCANSVRFSSLKQQQWRAEDKAEEFVFPSMQELSEQQRCLLSQARSLIGTPYCFGGSGSECYDCSGFVSEVYRRCGITVARTSKDMSLATLRRRTGVSDAKVGDLVFFSTDGRGGVSHVGMYSGGGTMIHASTSLGVRVEQLSSEYYASRLLFIGSVLADR